MYGLELKNSKQENGWCVCVIVATKNDRKIDHRKTVKLRHHYNDMCVVKYLKKKKNYNNRVNRIRPTTKRGGKQIKFSLLLFCRFFRRVLLTK